MTNMIREQKNLKENLAYWFCNILLLLAIAISCILFTLIDPINKTLSDFGRDENYFWYLVWGILTCFGLLFNLRYLCRKLNIKIKLLDIAVIVGCLSVLITVTVIGGGKEAPWTFGKVLHWIASLTFGIVSYGSAVFIFVYAAYVKKDVRFRKYIFFILLTGLIDVIFMCFFGLSLVIELFILIGCKIIIWIANFINKPIEQTVSAEIMQEERTPLN